MTADLADGTLAGSSSALHLFDGPYAMICGRRVEVPDGGKRLLTLVALGGRRLDRRVAAGALWPVGSDARAAGNLRSALWRLRGAGLDIVEADKWALRLVPDIAVDVRMASERAMRLIEGRPWDDDLDLAGWRSSADDLLPGWSDDWVILERERVRQRLLHGLEAASRHLARRGRWAEAVDAALMAIAAEPLRESASRALVQAHLARGDVAAARRVFEAYSRLIARKLGARPSEHMTALLRPR